MAIAVNPYQATVTPPPPDRPVTGVPWWQRAVGDYTPNAPRQQISPPTFQGSAGLAATNQQPWGINNLFRGTNQPAAFRLSGPALDMWNQQSNVYDAQGRQLEAQGNVLGARGNVLRTQQGLMPYYQNQLQARGGVLDAQARQQQLERAYLQSTGQNIAANQQEENAIFAASQNVPDLTAVAQVNQARGAVDARARQYGVTPEEDINVPMGQQGVALPPGVRAAARPTFQYLSENAQHAQHNREFALQTARNAVDMAGTDVNAAQQIASRAGLSLDEAQLLVTQAQNEENQAQLGASGAGLAVNEAQLLEQTGRRSPFPGEQLYVDPVTGESSWQSPSGAAALQLPYEVARSNALYNQRRATRYDGNTLAGFPDSYLGTLLVNNVEGVTEQDIREALAIKGYSASKIDIAIARMRLQKPVKRTGSLGTGDILGGGTGDTAGTSASTPDDSPATQAENDAIARALGF